MNKWQQIEDLINKLLAKFGQDGFSFLKKCTPENIKKTGKEKKKKLVNSKVDFKNRIQKSQRQFVSKLSDIKANAVIKINTTKSKTQDLVKSVKSTDLKKLNYRAIFLVIFAVFIPLYVKISKWVLTFKPATIVMGISMTTLVGITGVGVYNNSKKILDQTREPASVEVDPKTNIRPDYYKDNEKVFLVRNINLPVYIESSSKSKKHSMKKIVIDISFLTSNKYIKAFFWENPHLIHNKINSDLEPLTIDFPLEPEGRTIIRAKLLELGNELIDELKIKGSIKQVYLNSQVGA